MVVLETDKVSVDVRSPKAGQITEQLAKIQAVRVSLSALRLLCVPLGFTPLFHMPPI